MKSPALKRELGVPGAVLLGLGSIVGTGVFVSLAIATGVAGAWALPAVIAAGALAFCNGLSSAQLAAAHPVAGGTYAYGHRYLTPTLGFAAGACFLLAKSASAATAALGFAGYVAYVTGIPARWHIPLALAAVAGLTAVVLSGARRSNAANTVIVLITFGALILFVATGLPSSLRNAGENIVLDLDVSAHGPAFLHATALLFVAYTGYGRIATMGEEARNPRRTIPLAILVTVSVSAAIYIAVTWVGIAALGADAFASPTTLSSPLEAAAAAIAGKPVALCVTLGAITAMLGVLLNLILGLSRVALAMGRERDLPGVFAHINEAGTTPTWSVIGVAAVVAAIVLCGSVIAAWSFSAFTVLVYYGLTNMAALRLDKEDRLYPRIASWIGLVGCFALAFWIEPRYLVIGTALIAACLTLRAILKPKNAHTA